MAIIIASVTYSFSHLSTQMKQLIRRELFLLQMIIIIRDRSMTSDFIPITFQSNRYVHRKRRRKKKAERVITLLFVSFNRRENVVIELAR